MFDLTQYIQNVISTSSNIKIINEIFKITLSIWNLVCIWHLDLISALLTFQVLHGATCGKWRPYWVAQSWFFEGKSVTFASGSSEAEPFPGLSIGA